MCVHIRTVYMYVCACVCAKRVFIPLYVCACVRTYIRMYVCKHWVVSVNIFQVCVAIDYRCLIWISNMLKNAYIVFNYPHYGVPVSRHLNFPFKMLKILSKSYLCVKKD